MYLHLIIYNDRKFINSFKKGQILNPRETSLLCILKSPCFILNKLFDSLNYYYKMIIQGLLRLEKRNREITSKVYKGGRSSSAPSGESISNILARIQSQLLAAGASRGSESNRRPWVWCKKEKKAIVKTFKWLKDFPNKVIHLIVDNADVLLKFNLFRNKHLILWSSFLIC